MGIKTLKNIFLGLIVTLLVFASPKIFAQSNEQTTNKNVRVAIGNQNFSNYSYDKITLFGTSDIQIYNLADGNLITEIPSETPFEISIKDNSFELTFNKEKREIIDNFAVKTDGLLGIKDLKRKGKQALYHTCFEIIKKPKTDSYFYVVNVLDIQDYLKGVVPNEMPTHFGLEALKAQAVAARNYVLSPRTKLVDEYDVVDSVSSQVYFGANTEEKLSNEAVDKTDGIVALYNWKLILAQYSSTAGGYTESFANAFSDPITKKFPSDAKPYLVAKADMLTQQPLRTEEQVAEYYINTPDSYDIRSPYYRWQKMWTKDELEQILSKTLVEQSSTGFVHPKLQKASDFGKLKDIKPKRRGDSGKLIDIEIITDRGTYTVQKELVIRRIFQKNKVSLPSANVVFDLTFDDKHNLTDIVAYGGGFGHGVGMSQYGAGYMATKKHQPYYNILRHYYKGINLGTMPVEVINSEVEQSFWAPIGRAHIVIVGPSMPKINVMINGKPHLFSVNRAFLQKDVKIDISRYIEDGENKIIFYPAYFPMKVYVELVESYHTNTHKTLWGGDLNLNPIEELKPEEKPVKDKTEEPANEQ